MRFGGPFGFNISSPVSRKHHRARLGELHVGVAPVQGEPAVGNRTFETRLVFCRRSLEPVQERLVDLLDIDAPVLCTGSKA